LVGIVSANWSLLVHFSASVGILLAVVAGWIMNITKEADMKKTVAKAIILAVGTALLGWAGLATCFRLQRREGQTASEDAT
jgi:thiol:disulfide interchange protein